VINSFLTKELPDNQEAIQLLLLTVLRMITARKRRILMLPIATKMNEVSQLLVPLPQLLEDLLRARIRE
jgi:hypothetical protein